MGTIGSPPMDVAEGGAGELLAVPSYQFASSLLNIPNLT
jgi:hypothetical protein